MNLGMKVGLGSIGSFVAIVIFGFLLFPKIVTNQVKSMTNLKKGNDIRDMYLKLPFPMKVKFYLFNVTNPVEVNHMGAKPILREMGPYVYDEWKEKVDVVENEADDTLLYTIRNTYIFNQKDSGGLTGNELVTTPHPLIAAVVMTVLRDKPAVLTFLNKALLSIYRNPETIFVTTTVDELLFSGITILCNVTDFAGKAICTQLKTEVKDLVELEPGILKFSLLGGKNGTKGSKIKVKRGIKKSYDTGRMVEFEGKPELDMWGSKECNQLIGTDSTIFPPFLEKEEGLLSFTTDICRSLPATYIEDTKYGGLPVRKYSANFGDMSTDYNQCYCPSPDMCYKKGIHDLNKCLSAPLVASLPHFYLADPSYGAGVIGLNPSQVDHEIIILFEHMTGSPVLAKKRLQYNIPLQAVPKITVMQNLSEVMFPLFWVEEGVELNKTWTSQINNQLFRVMKAMKIVQYIVMVGSIGGMAAGAYLHFAKKNEVPQSIAGGAEKQVKRHDISLVTLQQHNNGGHVNHAMSNDRF